MLAQKVEEFFNNEIKQKFLSQFPETTQVTYGRIFTKSSVMEKNLNKDIYDFNYKELFNFLNTLNPLTNASSRSNGRIVSSYIYWAVSQGLKKNGINPFATTKQEWFDQFVDKTVRIMISESEMMQVEDFCYNAQDAVIFRLIFEGVQGKECRELSNLKWSDVDRDTNILTLFDGDNKRELHVSNRCIRMIEEAFKQTQYLKRNGDMDDPNGNLRDYTDLVQNNYILRSSVTRTHAFAEGVNKHTIYRRISGIKEAFGFPHLTVKNIARSGMLKMGKDLLEEYGELNKDLYERIAKKFGVNNYWYVSEFVNEDTIKEVYGG